MLPNEVLKLAYEQDSKWGQVMASTEPRDKGAAKKMKKFLDTNWSRLFANIIDEVELGKYSLKLTGGYWNAKVEEILAAFNEDVYPKARKAGFPEWSFTFPDITINGVVKTGAPFGGLMNKLANLLSSKEVHELAPFGGLGGVVAVDVANDLLAGAKANDPAAVKSLADIHRDAGKGDPSAKAAVKTLAVVDAAQHQKASPDMSFYERGVAVGHLPWDVVGQDSREHRKGRPGSAPGGGIRVTQGANRAGYKKLKKQYVLSGPQGTVRYHPGTYSAANPIGTYQDAINRYGGLTGLTPTALSRYQGKGRGLTDDSPLPFPVPEGAIGVDDNGYPIYPDQEGQAAYDADPLGLGTIEDPFGDYGDPYGGLGGEMEVDPYTGEVFDPYADLYSFPTGFQTYDPATDSFYSDRSKQEYDPDTDSFYDTGQGY